MRWVRIHGCPGLYTTCVRGYRCGWIAVPVTGYRSRWIRTRTTFVTVYVCVCGCGYTVRYAVVAVVYGHTHAVAVAARLRLRLHTAVVRFTHVALRVRLRCSRFPFWLPVAVYLPCYRFCVLAVRGCRATRAHYVLTFAHYRGCGSFGWITVLPGYPLPFCPCYCGSGCYLYGWFATRFGLPGLPRTVTYAAFMPLLPPAYVAVHARTVTRGLCRFPPVLPAYRSTVVYIYRMPRLRLRFVLLLPFCWFLHYRSLPAGSPVLHHAFMVGSAGYVLPGYGSFTTVAGCVTYAVDFTILVVTCLPFPTRVPPRITVTVGLPFGCYTFTVWIALRLPFGYFTVTVVRLRYGLHRIRCWFGCWFLRLPTVAVTHAAYVRLRLRLRCSCLPVLRYGYVLTFPRFAVPTFWLLLISRCHYYLYARSLRLPALRLGSCTQLRLLVTILVLRLRALLPFTHAHLPAGSLRRAVAGCCRLPVPRYTRTVTIAFTCLRHIPVHTLRFTYIRTTPHRFSSARIRCTRLRLPRCHRIPLRFACLCRFTRAFTVHVYTRLYGLPRFYHVAGLFPRIYHAAHRTLLPVTYGFWLPAFTVVVPVTRLFCLYAGCYVRFPHTGCYLRSRVRLHVTAFYTHTLPTVSYVAVALPRVYPSSATTRGYVATHGCGYARLHFTGYGYCLLWLHHVTHHGYTPHCSSFAYITLRLVTVVTTPLHTPVITCPLVLTFVATAFLLDWLVLRLLRFPTGYIQDCRLRSRLRTYVLLPLIRCYATVVTVLHAVLPSAGSFYVTTTVTVVPVHAFYLVTAVPVTHTYRTFTRFVTFAVTVTLVVAGYVATHVTHARIYLPAHIRTYLYAGCSYLYTAVYYVWFPVTHALHGYTRLVWFAARVPAVYVARYAFYGYGLPLHRWFTGFCRGLYDSCQLFQFPIPTVLFYPRLVCLRFACTPLHTRGSATRLRFPLLPPVPTGLFRFFTPHPTRFIARLVTLFTRLHCHTTFTTFTVIRLVTLHAVGYWLRRLVPRYCLRFGLIFTRFTGLLYPVTFYRSHVRIWLRYTAFGSGSAVLPPAAWFVCRLRCTRSGFAVAVHARGCYAHLVPHTAFLRSPGYRLVRLPHPLCGLRLPFTVRLVACAPRYAFYLYTVIYAVRVCPVPFTHRSTLPFTLRLRLPPCRLPVTHLCWFSRLPGSTRSPLYRGYTAPRFTRTHTFCLRTLRYAVTVYRTTARFCVSSLHTALVLRVAAPAAVCVHGCYTLRTAPRVRYRTRFTPLRFRLRLRLRLRLPFTCGYALLPHRVTTHHATLPLPFCRGWLHFAFAFLLPLPTRWFWLRLPPLRWFGCTHTLLRATPHIRCRTVWFTHGCVAAHRGCVTDAVLHAHRTTFYAFWLFTRLPLLVTGSAATHTLHGSGHTHLHGLPGSRTCRLLRHGWLLVTVLRLLGWLRLPFTTLPGLPVCCTPLLRYCRYAHLPDVYHVHTTPRTTLPHLRGYALLLPATRVPDSAVMRFGFATTVPAHICRGYHWLPVTFYVSPGCRCRVRLAVWILPLQLLRWLRSYGLPGCYAPVTVIAHTGLFCRYRTVTVAVCTRSAFYGWLHGSAFTHLPFAFTVYRFTVATTRFYAVLCRLPAGSATVVTTPRLPAGYTFTALPVLPVVYGWLRYHARCVYCVCTVAIHNYNCRFGSRLLWLVYCSSTLPTVGSLHARSLRFLTLRLPLLPLPGLRARSCGCPLLLVRLCYQFGYWFVLRLRFVGSAAVTLYCLWLYGCRLPVTVRTVATLLRFTFTTRTFCRCRFRFRTVLGSSGSRYLFYVAFYAAPRFFTCRYRGYHRLRFCPTYRRVHVTIQFVYTMPVLVHGLVVQFRLLPRVTLYVWIPTLPVTRFAVGYGLRYRYCLVPLVLFTVTRTLRYGCTAFCGCIYTHTGYARYTHGCRLPCVLLVGCRFHAVLVTGSLVLRLPFATLLRFCPGSAGYATFFAVAGYVHILHYRIPRALHGCLPVVRTGSRLVGSIHHRLRSLRLVGYLPTIWLLLHVGYLYLPCGLRLFYGCYVTFTRLPVTRLRYLAVYRSLRLRVRCACGSFRLTWFIYTRGSFGCVYAHVLTVCVTAVTFACCRFTCTFPVTRFPHVYAIYCCRLHTRVHTPAGLRVLHPVLYTFLRFPCRVWFCTVVYWFPPTHRLPLPFILRSVHVTTPLQDYTRVATYTVTLLPSGLVWITLHFVPTRCTVLDSRLRTARSFAVLRSAVIPVAGCVTTDLPHLPTVWLVDSTTTHTLFYVRVRLFVTPPRFTRSPLDYRAH